MTAPTGRQAHDPWAPHAQQPKHAAPQTADRSARKAPPTQGVGESADDGPETDDFGPRDLSKLKKAELVLLADRVGLDNTGTREELIDRITEARDQQR